MMPRRLAVAGEPSGDRTLAMVLRAMGGDARWVGVGGQALMSAGCDLFARVEDVSGMGVADVVRRAPAIAAALRSLRRCIDDGLELAVLCSWSSANARIGRALRRRSVPVTWIAPPEVWAWLPWRARGYRASADRMVVTLPFEEPMWRALGVDARFFGHPVLDLPRPTRAAASGRVSLGGAAIALLPGSRPGEVRRHLPAFLDAFAIARRMRPELSARVLVAPGLPPDVRADVIERARAHAVATVDVDPIDGAMPLLPAFDVALCASGTASLECAIAGARPVIAYAVDRVAFAVAPLLVRTPYIALPNIVLHRARRLAPYVERIGPRLDAQQLADDLLRTLDLGALDAAQAALIESLTRVGFAKGAAAWIGERSA